MPFSPLNYLKEKKAKSNMVPITLNMCCRAFKSGSGMYIRLSKRRRMACTTMLSHKLHSNSTHSRKITKNQTSYAPVYLVQSIGSICSCKNENLVIIVPHTLKCKKEKVQSHHEQRYGKTSSNYFERSIAWLENSSVADHEFFNILFTHVEAPTCSSKNKTNPTRLNYQ